MGGEPDLSWQDELAQQISDDIDREILQDMGVEAYKSGQIHRFQHSVLNRDTMVLLLWKGGVRGNWECEDLKTGRHQSISERYLSIETFNEMEALAWLTR